jgi:RNA polymerase sigma factor (sigma-70 family)
MRSQEIKLLTLVAFVANYDSYFKSLLRFLSIRFRSSHLLDEDIEDMASDTMLAVLSQLQINDIVLTCKPQSFIASIGCNKTIDILRKRSRFVVVNELPKDVVAEDSPLSISIESDKETLRNFVDKLPIEEQLLLQKRYRGVFGNKKLAGMTPEEINCEENAAKASYAEIAAELGLEAGALRVRMCRLLSELKEGVRKAA